MFYIVREGKLALETIIESEQNLKYPKDAKSWEVKKTTKVMQYHLRDLNQGDYFGHEEILSDKNLTKRQTRVKCLNSCQIIYINKDDLLNQFYRATLKEMKERHCHMIELDTIVASISKY